MGDVETFEQARALDRDALHALLESERPEQRVWAVWAIALSLGERAGGFAHRVESEPDPGVRRALAVILASHGEYDFLVQLAQHDPAAVVRESTTQMITRIVASANNTANPRLRDVVENAERGTPAIRVAMLGGITRGAPEFLVAIAQRLLHAYEREVQEEAFETLLRLDLPATRELARDWFRDQPQLWHYIDRWLRASTLEELAEVVADLAMTIRGRVLDKLRSPPWPVVERVVGADRELLRAILDRSDIAIPARVLAAQVRSGAHDGFAGKLASQLQMAARGRVLLGSLRTAIDDDDDGSSLLELAGHVRRYADALEIADRDEVLAELASAHPVEHLLGLENAVARWAEHAAPADLQPMLPDLLAYCREHLARMVRNNTGTTRPRRRPGELIAPGSAPRTEREVFGELVVSLDQLVAR